VANNRNRKYLVIAEVERTGFVAGCYKKYLKAVELANELLLYGELFPWCESDKIIGQLRNRSFNEYPVKGNQIYFDKGIYGSADGKYSVMVIQINNSHFDLNVFIKERENHSIVFDSETCCDKRWNSYFDKFPSSYQIAN
jgi:hypothetical protein